MSSNFKYTENTSRNKKNRKNMKKTPVKQQEVSTITLPKINYENLSLRPEWMNMSMSWYSSQITSSFNVENLFPSSPSLCSTYYDTYSEDDFTYDITIGPNNDNVERMEVLDENDSFDDFSDSNDEYVQDYNPIRERSSIIRSRNYSMYNETYLEHDYYSDTYDSEYEEYYYDSDSGSISDSGSDIDPDEFYESG